MLAPCNLPSLDELITQIKNMTSLVEGMVGGPQPHDEGPPTQSSDPSRVVDPNGEQKVQIPPLQDSHVSRRSNAS